MDLKELSEKVEQISQNYSDKFKVERNNEWYILKLQEELGELIQSYLMMMKQARAKGKNEQELRENFELEAADVLCHVLLLARHFNIDLETVIKQKWLVWNR